VLPDFEIFGITIHTFGLTLVAALLASIAVLGRRFEETGRPVSWAAEEVTVGLLSGMAGAYVFYLADHLRDGNFVELVLEGGGLAWYGGLIGAAIGVAVWARWRGILSLSLADAAAPVLALSQAILRIGCQLSGDGDYGTQSDLPWAMGYPDGIVPTAPGVTVHPTPIYETLALGLIALALWRCRDRVRPGVLFAMYLVLAGLQRFLVEFVRVNDDVLGTLSFEQLLSMAMVVAGAAWLLHSTAWPDRVRSGGDEGCASTSEKDRPPS
jgi:phosphatidylglycerol:prolipoprotein diacylglycerol transferase